MTNTLVALILLIIFIAGIIALQVFLSKAANKWLGFILPAIHVVFSLLVVFGQAMFAPGLDMVFTILYIFLIFNIPTVILLAIYAACRGNRKRNLSLEKMSVQDLE